MIIRTLNDMQIRSFKPTERQYRKCADRNLYIEVFPSGSKSWSFRVRGRSGEKDAILGLGRYPAVTLEKARALSRDLSIAFERGASIDELRVIIDPNKAPKTPTFEEISRLWYAQKELTAKEITLKDIRSRLAIHILPALGERPVNEIAAREILDTLAKVQAMGKLDLAHRLKDIISGVMRHAVILGHVQFDPTVNLRGQLQSAKHKPFGSILDPAGIADLIRKINSYESVITRLMLKFSLLTFQRPSEIRLAEWEEFDFVEEVWRVPTDRKGNKRERPHLVPLARQALAILRELESFKAVTGNSDFVFPGRYTVGKPVGPMSENTIRKAFQVMG